MEAVLTYLPQFSDKTERSHKGYSQNFNFSYVPAYHNHHVSQSNSPPQQDETASATNPVRMQTLEARVYAWMEGIPPEDELMDPNFNEADGITDSEREWVRAVSPSSIGSSVGRPGSSTAVVCEGVADGYHRDRQDAMVKGKARDDEGARIVEELAPAMRSISRLSSGRPWGVAAKGDKKQNRPAGKSAATTTQNTPPPPAKFARPAIDLPKTESLERLIQESITSGVVDQTPPPDLPLSSSQPFSFLKKKGKSKKASLWKRFTKRYSEPRLL